MLLQNTLTKSSVAEHSMTGTTGPGGCKDRLIVASSFIGSMRYRLVTADELKSITPLHQKKKFKNKVTVYSSKFTN